LTPIVTDKKTERSEVKDLPNPKPNCPEKYLQLPYQEHTLCPVDENSKPIKRVRIMYLFLFATKCYLLV